MKLEAFEAHASCGYFAPNDMKNGSVDKKLSSKNQNFHWPRGYIYLKNIVIYILVQYQLFLKSSKTIYILVPEFRRLRRRYKGIPYKKLYIY